MSSRGAILMGLALVVTTLGGATVAGAEEPPAGGQRYAVPEAGFALTFPDDWNVVEVTPESFAPLWKELNPDGDLLRWPVLIALGLEQSCGAIDNRRYAEAPPAWTTLSEYADDFIVGLDRKATAYSRTDMDLAAGPAVRFDYLNPDGRPYTDYLATNGEAWLQLECGALERPADGWRSIAATLEWLPLEVQPSPTPAITIAPARSLDPATPPGPPFPEPIDGLHVYDVAGVLDTGTVVALMLSTAGIEARTGAQVVIYIQVKPESDTVAEAEADAMALMDQWDVGRPGIDDGLVILLDLDESRCHGQVQLYAGPGFRTAWLTNDERQRIFEEEMVPALQSCDLDGALLAAMERISAATTVEPTAEPPGSSGG